MNREFRDGDIRDLLGGALDTEPPMNIDRAAVIKAGKRSLRRRRVAAGVGVAAGVVAVALGATALAGPTALFGGPDLGPADSGPKITGTAPPATETTRPTAATTPMTNRTAPSLAAVARLPLNPEDGQSGRLRAIYEAAFTSVRPLPHWADLIPSNPKFEVVDGRLRLLAELKDSQGIGEFRIEVAKLAGPGTERPCGTQSSGKVDAITCEPLDFGEVPGGRLRAVYSVVTSGSYIKNVMTLTRPDGIEITASSTNQRIGGAGGHSRSEPTLTKANLRDVVMQPAYAAW
ncbi:hypothetical protein NLX83_07985 [Allokutzneria sp. A3M-2-11 16]|uniref:hypothetical protein n=1 Tax=Allokutzneria sp. A3M-2-11 16 TaxID=2962043 RepID=UPI0020B8F8AE|nr:hypothetical protein [Allokutzneria sp. A3M-2-11 16]MCP3799193.1 hypothetical protein [Allokutzneria sp. A3M-2-11 16]